MEATGAAEVGAGGGEEARGSGGCAAGFVVFDAAGGATGTEVLSVAAGLAASPVGAGCGLGEAVPVRSSWYCLSLDVVSVGGGISGGAGATGSVGVAAVSATGAPTPRPTEMPSRKMATARTTDAMKRKTSCFPPSWISRTF